MESWLVRYLRLDCVCVQIQWSFFKRGLSDDSPLSACIGQIGLEKKSPTRIPSWVLKSKLFKERLNALLRSAKL